jgi:UDP-N-acetylglucosamine acyltransferase
LNRIHRTAVVGAGVEMGSGNVVGPYSVLVGPMKLGDRNWIGPHAVLGTPPEIRDLDHHADVDYVTGAGIEIGDANVIRERTTIHRGHYAVTRIGTDCFLMNGIYIAHDVVIADRVTMSSGVALAGHVHVGAAANLGMGVVVHQHRVIGPLAMVGMASVVTRDLPPCSLSYGNPCRVRSANRVGMQRAGLPGAAVAAVDRVYTEGLPTDEARDPSTAWAWDWWDTEHCEGVPEPS